MLYLGCFFKSHQTSRREFISEVQGCLVLHCVGKKLIPLKYISMIMLYLSFISLTFINKHEYMYIITQFNV